MTVTRSDRVVLVVVMGLLTVGLTVAFGHTLRHAPRSTAAIEIACLGAGLSFMLVGIRIDRSRGEIAAIRRLNGVVSVVAPTAAAVLAVLGSDRLRESLLGFGIGVLWIAVIVGAMKLRHR